ncbi:phage antirepressor Ant [Salmonella enterica]|uniref:phage antirepressor KilAC domain-containing protein n=1 Tax=Salmonella enterica TaxID=28901 RepID=UPI000FB15470|nr:phage antirepressor Ant [Salmonella enterica]EBW4414395.1 phage antirepressor Ant [Salmonella enterica subsp. enterica serovar Typhimurium]ECI7832458.1 phage antirepressor Ant [Salmonella enterica subsp. enterica]EDU8541860.1 phage antirepressor Ant [Salmonella enterica subsp. enterica serovar Javiana]EEE3542941.1 phage antirepressor Ant [Salmonella enterica subsp. enterica serovar Poona]HAZ3068112.1 phage antirepressor Ant [Salmonella enterica subsp. enterica serovar Enteritidis]
MKTSLITREEMIEAIEQHTSCIATKEIPSVVVNYLMVTKRLYTRKDKNALKRILLTDVREYLVQQGRIPYAEVAAEKRKEAKMHSQIELLPPAPIASEIPQDGIDSQQLLKMVNETRKLCGEPDIRNNKFIEKVLDELDGEHYTKSVVQRLNNTTMTVVKMSYKQALRVAARESKAVRRSLIDKLEALQQAQSPSPVPAIPQSLPEALRLAAELAEQKQQLEEQLQTAAPKVDFADRVANAGGILIGNYAKVVGLGQNFLFTWLRDHGILCASGSRRNVPKQNFIEQGFFTVREVVIDNDDNYRIALTTQITGKGQQWLTRKLLDAGILKPVART